MLCVCFHVTWCCSVSYQLTVSMQETCFLLLLSVTRVTLVSVQTENDYHLSSVRVLFYISNQLCLV